MHLPKIIKIKRRKRNIQGTPIKQSGTKEQKHLGNGIDPIILSKLHSIAENDPIERHDSYVEYCMQWDRRRMAGSGSNPTTTKL
jgi:hypothetical protein